MSGRLTEVLLVHPSGGYIRKAPWSISKGLPGEEETDLEATARGETLEETGVAHVGPLVALGDITYVKSRKQVHCFAGPAPEEADPRPVSWEVDLARFVPLAEARRILHPDQCPFLKRVQAYLGKTDARASPS
jgi:predicted NUDIX family NTP pyrophosphohydrolase